MSDDDGKRSCPACGQAIVRPAREGGVMVLAGPLRMRDDGNADTRCPNPACKAPLELVRREGKPLIIRRLTTPASGRTTEPANR